MLLLFTLLYNMKIGANDIAAVKIGSVDVNKVYLGANLVWEKASPTPFIFEVTVLAGGTIDPTMNINPTYSLFQVDWGDGNVESFTATGKRLHTYNSAGSYEVKVFEGIGAVYFSADSWLSKINQWGSIKWTGLNFVNFFQSTNLLANYVDFPNLDLYNGSFFNLFNGCVLWNGYMDDWNVSGVTNFQNLFRNCTNFNQSLNTWNTSNVLNMGNLFLNCSNFNQPLNNWDTSKVTEFGYIFEGCTSFNQSLATWNVSSVTNMDRSFRLCTSFDQSLADWNITSVTNMNAMFAGVTLSTENYDATLISWAAQAVQSNVPFHGGNSKYTAGGAAEAARNTLINTYGWTITDGGAA